MPPQHSPFRLATSCQNQIMAIYQSKIRQQSQFLNLIRAALVPPLAEHLLYCVISGKNLLLYTDAEEWVAQLNHYLPVILTTISNSNLATVDFIHVRLIPLPAKQQATRNVNLPSKNNIQLIRDNLQAIKDDELKSALLRLSDTLDKLS